MYDVLSGAVGAAFLAAVVLAVAGQCRFPFYMRAVRLPQALSRRSEQNPLRAPPDACRVSRNRPQIVRRGCTAMMAPSSTKDHPSKEPVPSSKQADAIAR
jgi:hypothetical protein